MRHEKATTWPFANLCVALSHPSGDSATFSVRPARKRGSGPGDVSTRVPVSGELPRRIADQCVALSIARNVCADHVRNRVRQRRVLGVLSQATDDEWTPAPGNPTYALLEEIDPDRREAFVLTQVLGLSYDEAAIVLDCPIGTIRSRVARARVELADEVRAAEAC